MTKLHVFDMDGTILEGSACVHLSDHLGRLEEISVIEEGWGRGEVGHIEFYQLCQPLWVDLCAEDIATVFEKSPWRKNVERVFKDIAERGEFSAVVTLSPLFFAEMLLQWGVTSAHGAPIGPGEEVDPELVLTPDHKVPIVRRLMEEHGVDEFSCVAYGDSSSDIPLFETFSNTVAVNGSDTLKGLATKHYEGDDIWEAYQLGRSLIGG
ncbi:haloacid dehalogenase-like hydrolase [Methyloligella sp. 2.7D]|uniref:HAD family hydrolase n=1 Tax=unclassified Methyloligella TaxID=2625955 RepID=UPI00157D96D3|nr:haloacid dehalogenase-like hydrolase [Methyloligella sp. GL2]QKP76943.1 haloacid dehalogenase-like hydrolase [Methyloligella sp. GL2]